MTPEELQDATHQLREGALSIRRAENRIRREYPTTPATATGNMRNAAQLLDDAATDLLNAFGHDLPEGVM